MGAADAMMMFAIPPLHTSPSSGTRSPSNRARTHANVVAGAMLAAARVLRRRRSSQPKARRAHQRGSRDEPLPRSQAAAPALVLRLGVRHKRGEGDGAQLPGLTQSASQLATRAQRYAPGMQALLDGGTDTPEPPRLRRLAGEACPAPQQPRRPEPPREARTQCGEGPAIGEQSRGGGPRAEQGALMGSRLATMPRLDDLPDHRLRRRRYSDASRGRAGRAVAKAG
eukprot:CAMPEP_0204160220 /NCGR_PEP_ID=MMETSP0361-20130328/33681_1 /ASSEMBLY_ACC=CAM_ASM_000343 /TAXON_ID=268821 /ORGANISM="Scrippsiella Hangoei, Strain SHTV-5" /LENGTH=225 /DNA_ID=CAMNT_0051116453 /DNA_START=70 /DNA_END=743 /DNA_ORIENTATION=+